MKERFWELIFLRVVNFWQVGVRTVVSGFGTWLVRFSFLMNCPLVYRIKPREKNVLIDSSRIKSSYSYSIHRSELPSNWRGGSKIFLNFVQSTAYSNRCDSQPPAGHRSHNIGTSWHNGQVCVKILLSIPHAIQLFLLFLFFKARLFPCV